MQATLLSIIVAVPAVWLAYTMRAWWVARPDWPQLSADSKALYLLPAPPLILALDLFLITDRLFYSPRRENPLATRGVL